MDYIVNYNVSNVNIHCVIQEKDQIIGRQQKEIEDLHKANQLLAKEVDKLKVDLDLQKKLTESLEKFKYSLERNVAVLKDFDQNRWSASDAESEVRIWEHEYLMIKKMLDKREREETHALLLANNALNSINAINAHSDQMPNPSNPSNPSQVPKQSAHRRCAPKPKIGEDGSALKRYVCDYPNCTYRSNWAHDLKGHKRKHTGEKPYTCGWLNCNKSFRDLRDLKRHQRAHTGDKRYSCDWPGCDYRSTDVANLAKHKRTHTGEKPYKCDWAGCEASFADGSHLRRHMKKHENQLSKVSKSGTTVRKRQTTHKTTSVVKTRQQPGRRAKGSKQLIPLEVKLDLSQGVKSSATNELNKLVENNNLNTNSEINKSIDNSVNLTKESNRSEVNPSISAEMTGTVVNTSSMPESTNSVINSSLMNESNERIDNNSNSIIESNRSDMNSVSIDGQNESVIDDNNQRLVISNLMPVNTNPIVITSAMIAQTNRSIDSINSSPLQESVDKQTISRYQEVIENTNQQKEIN